MDIHHLRTLIGQEIVDYNQLTSLLKHYFNPRKKISAWLKSGELTRVKKGLYVFGPQVRRPPFSINQLANMIYGPSAISLSYALAFYGIIPEAVHTVSSITNKRNKHFNTPVGTFTYRYLAPEKYFIGIQLLSTNENDNFLIATPEKALCDLVALDSPNLMIESAQDIENFIVEDLRADEDIILKLDIKLLQNIADTYKFSRLNDFTKYFKLWKSKQ